MTFFCFHFFELDKLMTEIKELNLEIAEFVGLDPETLGNMGEVHVEFKEDVAELLKKAFVHVKKMRVLKELLEFVHGPNPLGMESVWYWNELYYVPVDK